jgi:hypothetical protein
MNHKAIVERLDVLISLLIPRFDSSKYQERGVQLDVPRLCDYENTADDMVRQLKKTRNRIDVNLSKLRAKGLIRSVTKNGQTVYVRLG